ncbi:hypothetical protein QBC44DRAFT_367000 [Cladorrhinum sp. PSN332]|nr:hypothetical protein QBC44DRAFT_367000 [Cladorrhinum sp. PSN332]
MSLADFDKVTISLDQVRKLFAKAQGEYHQSECKMSIIAFFVARTPAGGWPIDRAIMVGSGSFSVDCSLGDIKNHLKQLAFFLHVVELIKLHLAPNHPPPGQRFGILAQEHFYRWPTDLEFLHSLGVEDVWHPEAFQVSDCNTFAYAPFVTYYTTLPKWFLSKSRDPPCLYIGNGVRGMIKSAKRDKRKGYWEEQIQKAEARGGWELWQGWKEWTMAHHPGQELVEPRRSRCCPVCLWFRVNKGLRYRDEEGELQETVAYRSV